MTGLSILYNTKGTTQEEWSKIPDNRKAKRLREIYWTKHAIKILEEKKFLKLHGYNWIDRNEINRNENDPGDSFILMMEMWPEIKDKFKWLEVTEVFTTIEAQEIEAVMNAWNGFNCKQKVDFEKFKERVNRERPLRIEQRKAADKVIKTVKRKITKSSYNELLENYGYGILVVGMPLWFAVPPDNPLRAENVLNN